MSDDTALEILQTGWGIYIFVVGFLIGIAAEITRCELKKGPMTKHTDKEQGGGG